MTEATRAMILQEAAAAREKRGKRLGCVENTEPVRSPEEIAAMAAADSRLQAMIAVQTIQSTATLSALAEHYAQIAPEVSEEMRDLVRTYANNGINRLKNWYGQEQAHDVIEVEQIDAPSTMKGNGHMFFGLFEEKKLICPYCGQEMPTPPGCDPGKITLQKKGWFSRATTTTTCPHCRGVSEVVKAGWF